MDDRLLDLLLPTVDDALTKETLPGVLDALEPLAAPIGLWASWVTVFVDWATLRVVALSSRFPSIFDPGAEVSVANTPDARAYLEESSSGQIFLHSTSSGSLGLLDDVLLAEGVKRVAVLPLLERGVLVANLVVASAIEDGLRRSHLPFLEGLARGLESHVVALIRASAWAEGTVLG